MSDLRVPNKRVLVFIGGGLLAVILIVVFSFLIFNAGEKQKEIPANAQPVNSSQVTDQDNSPMEKVSEDKAPDNQSILKNAPYTNALVDGQPVTITSGDMVIDNQGNLLIKSDFIQKALGKKVTWEKDTVYIGLQPVEIAANGEMAQYLADMENLRLDTHQEMGGDQLDVTLNSNKWPEKDFTIAGTQFNRGIGFAIDYNTKWSNKPFSIDYNLASGYKQFKAMVGEDDTFKDSTNQYVVRILGDGKKLFETKTFRGGDFAIPVEVDVTGVIRLSIEVNRVTEQQGNSHEEGAIVLAEARLIK